MRSILSENLTKYEIFLLLLITFGLVFFIFSIIILPIDLVPKSLVFLVSTANTNF